MPRYRTPLSLTPACLWILLSFSSTAGSDPWPCTHEKATIRGLIRDFDGAPLPQANVTFSGMLWDSTCSRGTLGRIQSVTDRQGRYTLVVPSGLGSLYVEHSRHRDWLLTNESFSGSMVIDHRFVRHHVRGRIVAADSVLGEAMLTYYPDPGRAGMMCGTGLPEVRTTDRTFDISVDRTGRYIVAAWIPSEASPWAPVGGEAITSLFINRDTTLTLDLRRDSIRGTVRGYAGLPVRRAEVFAYGPNGSSRTYCDSTGQFAIRLPPGSYWWSVEPIERDVERWTSPEALEVAADHVVDLDLDLVEWIGTARYEGGAEGVPGVIITAESEGRESGFTPARCVTDQYGDFRLTVRRGASHRLTVRDADPSCLRPERVRALTIGGARSVTDSTFDIALERMWIPEPRRVVCPSPYKSTIGTRQPGPDRK